MSTQAGFCSTWEAPKVAAEQLQNILCSHLNTKISITRTQHHWKDQLNSTNCFILCSQHNIYHLLNAKYTRSSPPQSVVSLSTFSVTCNQPWSRNRWFPCWRIIRRSIVPNVMSRCLHHSPCFISSHRHLLSYIIPIRRRVNRHNKIFCSHSYNF